MVSFNREQMISRVGGVAQVLDAIKNQSERFFAAGDSVFDKAFESYYRAQMMVHQGKLEDAERERLNAITLANTVMVNLTQAYIYRCEDNLINGVKKTCQEMLDGTRKLLGEENQKEIGTICREIYALVEKTKQQAKTEAEKIKNMKSKTEIRLKDFQTKMQGVSREKRYILEDMIRPVGVGLEMWPSLHDLTSDLMDAAEAYLERAKRFFYSDSLSTGGFGASEKPEGPEIIKMKWEDVSQPAAG